MTYVSDLQAPHSGVTTIDALLDDGPFWNHLAPARTVIYYAFAPGDVAATTAYVETAFSAAERSATTAALAEARRVTGITFTRVADLAQADMVFANTELGSYAGRAIASWNYRYDWTELITELTIGSYVYVDHEYATQVAKGEFGYQTLLHEIGHALGLKHPFEGSTRLPAGQDNWDYTLMSYTRGSGGYKTAYQQYDVAALEHLYGRDGLGGLRGIGATGTRTQIGGAPDDRLLGTGRADTLVGNGGNDMLNGRGGADTLRGGAGNDTYVVDSAGDVASEQDESGRNLGGNDLVRASVDWRLGRFLERLSLTGSAHLQGKGNGLANTIVGNAGNNLLSGYGGKDKLVGGKGKDTLLGGSGGDVLTGGGGADRFRYQAPGEGGDRITDFSMAQGDRLMLRSAGFGGITGLTNANFRSAAGLTSADTSRRRFLFDSATGNLRYDADGLGGSGAVVIARINLNGGFGAKGVLFA